MEAIMLVAKINGKWQPLGETYLTQIPRIGETIVKTILGKPIYLKVTEVLHNGDYTAGETSATDVYAIETDDLIARLYAS